MDFSKHALEVSDSMQPAKKRLVISYELLGKIEMSVDKRVTSPSKVYFPQLLLEVSSDEDNINN